MARIAGVNIPREKRVEIGLTYIYGIGRSTAQKICTELGIETQQKVHDLTDEEVARLRAYIDTNVQVEGDLRRERCRLLRTAFVLSLGDAADPSRPTWRLFTHERPLAALTRLGHRPGPGQSPVCPDYFFPESEVLEQAISRAERLLREAPIGAAETRSRVQALKLRYLSRGGVQRSPAG